MRNIFLNQSVPEPIARLFQADTGWTTTTPITLTPSDPPYFHYAVMEGAIPPQPSYVTELPPIQETPFVSLAIPAEPTAAIQRELKFLDTLGLLVYRDGAYYVSPLAEALYGPTGPFQVQVPTKGLSAADRRSIYLRTAGLFLRYVIPGYTWRAFLYRTNASNESGVHTDMSRALMGLQTLSAQLEAIIGMGSALAEPSKSGRVQSATDGVKGFMKPPPSGQQIAAETRGSR